MNVSGLKLDAQIEKSWQEFRELTDEQMECVHNFWETPNHWGGICQYCKVYASDSIEGDEFAYFHDGYQLGWISREQNKKDAL